MMHDVIRIHKIKSVAILFSEFYFYLVAYMADGRKDFPTTFRIDRMQNFTSTGEKFYTPYSQKFNDGEFSKRVQFMYAGELRKVKFIYTGPSLESVLSRLFTAKEIGKSGNGFIIEDEIYGDDINMWLRGQGENIRIL